MLDLKEELIRTVLGVSVGTAVAIAVILYVVRHAVAKAVELAGQKELERLKVQLAAEIDEKRNAFTLELEAKREAFARELEAQRRGAAREIEEFKAELTTAAEIRRQVAAERVKAVMILVKEGEPLIRAVFQSPPGPEAQDQALNRIHHFADRVGETAHLFDEDVAAKLHGYAIDMMIAHASKNSPPDLSAWDAASKAYQSLMALIRLQLGVKVGVSNEQLQKASSAAGE
jgi:hypothetical protein